ncbi:hypothetical protein TrRE_jg6573 [Triparma retinervis]|uniref:Uncharacterized protein n=1 Tax=Triparma retinervis TaxID=2557542 RepID=A0A9W7KSP2_9STRA|nr:hypothetical protein TrRE_jg6573 [Triparma retinervis]
MRVCTLLAFSAALGAKAFVPSSVPSARLTFKPISPLASPLVSPPQARISAVSKTSLSMSTTAAEDKPAEQSDFFKMYLKTASAVTNLFPIWTVISTIWALKRPADFAWFTTEYFTAGLAALMLSMGITLAPSDFVRVGKRPNAVIIQFLLCYAMMPLLALALGIFFRLDPALLAGMVLVGSINGGQASNLCTYIAKGNVALSVLMTTATTLGAIFMTPVLCKSILGTVVPVDAAGIAVSTIQVVLAPIAIGMTTNKFFPKFVKAILPFAPLVGIASTCLLVASAVAQVSEPILNAGLKLQFPVLLLHLLGGLIGYILPQMVGFGEVASRTMAIETSMKSSAFGFLLAKLHFGQYAARVPSAVSVVWMALTGSILAVIWRYIPVPPPESFDRSLVEKYPPFSLTRFLGRFKFWKKE